MLVTMQMGGKYMQEFQKISIRGRMAYILCLFERLLVYYKCTKEEWNWILEKLWEFTNIEYVDDWMYEIAEILPNSVMNDEPDELEFLTEEEFYRLKKIYVNNSEYINKMMEIVFELGTVEIYSRIVDYSPSTLSKLQEGISILQNLGIQRISVERFKQYHYEEANGWGRKFDGKELSIFL